MNSYDFFSALTEDKFTKCVCLSFAIAADLAIPLLFYTIIWYEKYGTDNKRTIINKFFSMICWSAIENCVLVQASEILLYIIGPLHANYCFFVRIFRSANFYQFLLYADLAMLSRYVYIFWLKNPASFKDDFWACFFNMWVKICTMISLTVYHTLLTHQPSNYYICAGINPIIAFTNPSRYHLRFLTNFDRLA
jgi:hypothetical protein